MSDKIQSQHEYENDEADRERERERQELAARYLPSPIADDTLAFEKCPNCQAVCAIKRYRMYKEGDKTFAAPPHIHCECGEVLEAVVPLFKVSGSGYVLQVKPKDKPLRE